MKTPPGTTVRLRQVMALLTLVAAFMFQIRTQIRTDALGQLTRPADASSTHSNHTTHAPAQSTPAQLTPATGHASHLAGHQHHAPASPSPFAQSPQSSQMPRPSEPSHHHSAHCPFCLTNAFGLEAGITGFPQGPPDFLPAPEPQLFPVYVAAWRYPDARAPPVL